VESKVVVVRVGDGGKVEVSANKLDKNQNKSNLTIFNFNSTLLLLFPREAAVTKCRRKELSGRSSGGRRDAPEWKQTGQGATYF
jgi:hypothetical protein